MDIVLNDELAGLKELAFIAACRASNLSEEEQSVFQQAYLLRSAARENS